MARRRTRHLSLLSVALVGVVLLLAACGDDGDESSSSDGSGSSGATEPAPAEDPLLDRTFVATSITEGGDDRALVEGTELRITVSEDSFSVNAGCNTMVGGYSVTDGDLALGEMGATMMACEPALDAEDTWLAEVLARPGQVEVAGEDVVLTFGDTVLTMADVDRVSPPADLVGTTWLVDSLTKGADTPDGSVSSVDPATGATLTLADDGTYALATGCNSGGGSYQADEDAGTITFDLPRLTRMACPDEVAQSIETGLLAVLDGEATYAIAEQRLTLTKGGEAVGFQAG